MRVFQCRGCQTDYEITQGWHCPPCPFPQGETLIASLDPVQLCTAIRCDSTHCQQTIGLFVIGSEDRIGWWKVDDQLYSLDVIQREFIYQLPQIKKTLGEMEKDIQELTHQLEVNDTLGPIKSKN